MKHHIFLAALLFLFTSKLSAQQSSLNPDHLNMDFELIDIKSSLPAMWISASKAPNYGIDSIVRHKGKQSAFLDVSASQNAQYRGTSIGQTIPLSYKGKKIKLTGFLKTKEVREGYASLFVRLDDEAGRMMIFDNMQETRL